jgi:hypothetical protein
MGLIPAGNYLGYRLGKDRDYSSGRGNLIQSTGIMGGVTGLLLPWVFFEDVPELDEHRRLFASTIMAGHALGTWFGFRFRKDNDYSFGQSVFMSLSAGCGTALALSLPLLANSEDHQPYLVAGIAGAWAGLYGGEILARNLFEKSAKDRKSAVSVSVPVAFQWPQLLLPQPRAKEGGLPDWRVDLVKVSVAL